MAELTIHGARGSLPVSGAATARYGGHTTAMSLAVGADDILVIDAGTGITRVPVIGGGSYHLLFSHFHLDHLIGLPFFDPLYDADAHLTMYGVGWGDLGVEESITGPYRSPWFPIEIGSTPSRKTYVEVGDEPLAVGDVKICTARLRHPQGVTAYRLDTPRGSYVIATDYEADGIDDDLVELASGADVLIHDAQYTPADYTEHEGWGHSTWVDAVAVAEAAGVGRLVLTSHDPSRTDDEIDAYVLAARDRFPSTDAAHEGMVIRL